MAMYFGPSSPKMMCSAEMQMKAMIAAIECEMPTLNSPSHRRCGSMSRSNAGSPTQPSASEASVTPSWVAER